METSGELVTLDESGYQYLLFSTDLVCTIEIEELLSIYDASDFEVTANYQELVEILEQSYATDGNPNGSNQTPITDSLEVEITLEFEELLGINDSSSEVEEITSGEFDAYFSCKLGVLSTFSPSFSNRLGVYADSNQSYSINLGVLEDNLIAVTNVCAAGNVFEPTIISNGEYIVYNASTAGGINDPSATCLYIAIKNDGLTACDICDLLGLNFTLDYNGGQWNLIGPCEIGECLEEVDIYGFRGTIKDTGFEISSSTLGYKYAGTFGALGLSKEFRYTLSGNPQFAGLLSNQTLQPPESSRWATASSAALAIAARAGVQLQWAVHDVPLKDFRLEEGQTALEALSTLASRVGAQLRWNGNNKYLICYPDFYVGLWEVPSCNLLLPGSQTKDCNCDLSTYLRTSRILIGSLPNRTDTGIKQLPNANAQNNGSSPQVQLIAKNTKRLTEDDPDLVYDLPFDYDQVFIQTLVPGNGVTGGQNLVGINNFVTRDPQQYHTFNNADLGEAFVLVTNIGGVYQPQVKLNYKVLPVEGSNDTIDAGNFVTSLYCTRKSLANDFQKQQEEEAAKQREDLGRTQDNYRWIKTCEYKIQVVFFGSIPVPGMWGRVTIPGVKMYKADCDNPDGTLLTDFGDVTLEGIIESVNFNYPGYITVTMAQYRKLLFYNSAQINYAP
jgi:hypothetical protein